MGSLYFLTAIFRSHARFAKVSFKGKCFNTEGIRDIRTNASMPKTRADI